MKQRLLIWVLLLLLIPPLGFVPACGGEDDEEEGSGSDVAAETGPSCTPACDGKDCGSDGCGGICGHCFTMEGAADDSLCLADGQCKKCGCGDQQCGLDPCGSPCGICPPLHTCSEAGACLIDINSCSSQGFAGQASQARLKEGAAGFSFRFESRMAAQPPTDSLILEINTQTPYNGPAQPGTYEAGFASFQQGGFWLYGQLSDSDPAAVRMVPISGEVEVVALSAAGGKFQAVLKGVVMIETTVNAATGQYASIPGGRVWCLDSVAMEADILVIPLVCGSSQTGTKLGEIITNFQLQNCFGEWVDLYQACKNYNAIWLVATAGW